MKKLEVDNPFNAPVYHIDTVTSTMDISRQLAKEGAPHGTVITADYQEAGRGRGLSQGHERTWEMNRGENLPFTMLLRYHYMEEIIPALTLRTGLAVSLAIENFAPSLQGRIKVKWPNDIMINNKKAVGILCEADEANVHIGIGINVAQKEFPVHLKEKATSIALEVDLGETNIDRFLLLKLILISLYNELEKPAVSDWKMNLLNKLYKKDEEISFIHGTADSKNEVKGRLAGIGENGEILIVPKDSLQVCSFITGELVVY